MRVVLITDWLTSMMLLKCILSTPVKAAVAVLINALAKTINDAICMRGAIVGRLTIDEARKPESKKPTTERTTPIANSNSKPDMNMLFMAAFRSSALLWAVYRTMAEFTPQSRNRTIRFGAVSAMAYRP